MSARDPSAPRAGGLDPATSVALTGQVTLFSVATAGVLVLIKLAGWWQSGSVAVLGSLADSGLDLVASLATFFAVRYAVAPPDAEHRFGHGKAEAFASLLQAGLVVASAALVGREAVQRLAHPQPLAASGWALAAMAVSTMLTGALIWAQTLTLRKTASVAVSSDRAHYTADLATNIAALAGIAGAAWLGWGWLDGAAGLLVAVWLAWGAIGVLRESSRHLMDRELNQDDRETVRALVAEDTRIGLVHQLRTRASGPFVHMQMHIELDPQLTLDAAHRIIIAAEKRILGVFPAADIIIHADPRGRAEAHAGAFAEAIGEE